MKKVIFCWIAVVVMTMLLLPSGQAFAKSKWEALPFGEDSLNTDNWKVEIETNEVGADCYDYRVEDGILKVWRLNVSNCSGKRIFVKVADGTKSEIQAWLTVQYSRNCFRSRIVADWIGTGNEEQVFHQFALMSNIGNGNCPDSVMSRVISYDSGRMFDGFIKGPWGSNLPIIGNTYLLTVGVQKDSFDAEIKNDLLESYGKVKFEVPGGQLTPNVVPYLGVSCYSSEDDSRGEAWFENPMVR